MLVSDVQDSFLIYTLKDKKTIFMNPMIIFLNFQAG